ncbi:hypothetical protein H6G54_25595 [Anabaena cylindrica FACHB-243]|uniref:Uncharacterized protein n=1 Tax=Anabaena cylindrica (strain ATCC 27899 / PCC 7122) TaxID=272123 RepID=K9ZF24_ANACC|nr:MULTISPECIES: hypothetical protein [Anabaena]AFZ57344.1 hypothetical protein Anacy_1854 [Anabaena cylindrica PCC 7122]MBD2421012.1 hypothetical protein [Anabaena cylindrica FACHB-243]MBY5280716.1 hypothetical protein [Anabaena sp. CCAP 1446/1C]MBY5306417.1 hypothetical protein [Anabaena sp. CCAP 1446/1C]MCM2405765.1 hypothetical protein [Anabaena sp. CCAP 1446/1C]
MVKKDQKQTSHEKVELYKVIILLLEAMQEEFQELTKKKPEAVLNKSKVKIVNRLLESCRKVLDLEASLEYLDLMDEDDIPQNSDVALMLSQYVAAMRQFKSTYYVHDGKEYRWFIDQ